jgi:hypothetical protein
LTFQIIYDVYHHLKRKRKEKQEAENGCINNNC